MPQSISSERGTRAQILEGARQAFARKGKAATMADVATAAGVSQGLAYRYFAGKDEIFRALVEHALEQAKQAMALPEHPSGTPGEQLAWLITQQVNFRRDHLTVFQLLGQVLSAEQVSDELAALIRRSRDDFFHAMRRLIVAGQATGEVAAGDPDQLILAIAATLEGLTRFGLHQPEQIQQRFPDASILLRMFKPD